MGGYIPSVNLTDFVCIGNVRYLDLSYNDIASISLRNMCWDIKLQVLNLDHNMLAVIDTSDPTVSNWLSYLQTVPKLKTLSVNYCSSTTSYHKGLRDDDGNRTDITGLRETDDENYDVPTLGEVIPHTPLSLFVGYGHWLHRVMKHCGNINIFQITKCIAYYEDTCAFFGCLAPDFNLKACEADNADRAYARFACQFCDYPAECLRGIQFPLPRSLTEISMREFGQYIDNSPRFRTNMQPNETVLCFDPNNNLESIDLTSAIVENIDLTIGQNVIHGLKKLKFLSIQGSHISYVINSLLFSDMESLEEIHVGGNRLFENDSLPAVMFQSNTKLSVLNLSYSHLQTIELDAFINNKNLSILDLSHNCLNASSLAALDLSRNTITHLNLSFNDLSTLPATL